MLRKIGLFVLASGMLLASQFVTLENGKTILLKDDGTYEQVTLVKREGKMIALKKDGTWEAVPEDIVVAETVVNKKSKAAYRARISKLAKALIGVWESRDGALVYRFDRDGKLRIKERNRWKETTWKVDDVDEAKRNIVVNIGEGENLGFLSFGGEHWILHIDEDGRTMHNETLKLRTFKDVVLIKQ
jgi:hypothetical protein